MRKKKLQLLREYFKTYGRIIRVRQEIKSAKNNVAHTKRNISEIKIMPGYFVKPYWYEWGEEHPCVLTHLRRGMRDMYTGEVFNFGDPDDVKTFCCPYFSWNKKCAKYAHCDYKAANLEYINAKNTLGNTIAEYNNARAERTRIRKQILSRNK